VNHIKTSRVENLMTKKKSGERGNLSERGLTEQLEAKTGGRWIKCTNKGGSQRWGNAQRQIRKMQRTNTNTTEGKKGMGKRGKCSHRGLDGFENNCKKKGGRKFPGPREKQPNSLDRNTLKTKKKKRLPEVEHARQPDETTRKTEAGVRQEGIDRV